MKSYFCLSRAATPQGAVSTEERRKKAPKKSDQFRQMGESFPDLGGITGAAHGAIGTSAAIAAGELAKGANQFTGIDAGFDGIGTAGNRDRALAAEHAAQGDDGIGIVAARFIDH